eukprot:m.4375 g.4375  ORF g.4375 m.4375 type:complete len:355 (-) comp2970_c0_seq1:538-1602(-)
MKLNLEQNVVNQEFFNNTIKAVEDKMNFDMLALNGGLSEEVQNLRTRQDQINKELREDIKKLNESQVAIIDALDDAVSLLQSLKHAFDCEQGNCSVKIPSCALTTEFMEGKKTVSTGGHDDAVPVGTLVPFTCKDGYTATVDNKYIATCKKDGWIGPACQECSKSLSGCATCTNLKTCLTCASGYKTITDSNYQTVSLTSDNMEVDPQGMVANGKLDEVKTCLVSGDKTDQEKWRSCPKYTRPQCAAPAWIQVDLKKIMRIGSVTTWMYYHDGRKYCGKRISISETGEFKGEEVVLHENQQPAGETSTGLVTKGGARLARYIRYESARNSVNEDVHFIGIEVKAVDRDVKCVRP